MYYFNVYYYLLPGKRDEFMQKLAELKVAELSREEDGCLQYDYFISVDSPDILLLAECWRDEEAQKAHCSSSHCLALQQIKARYVEKTEFKK